MDRKRVKERHLACYPIIGTVLPENQNGVTAGSEYPHNTEESKFFFVDSNVPLCLEKEKA
jgi:hypothetical protein